MKKIKNEYLFIDLNEDLYLNIKQLISSFDFFAIQAFDINKTNDCIAIGGSDHNKIYFFIWNLTSKKLLNYEIIDRTDHKDYNIRCEKVLFFNEKHVLAVFNSDSDIGDIISQVSVWYNNKSHFKLGGAININTPLGKEPTNRICTEVSQCGKHLYYWSEQEAIIKHYNIDEKKVVASLPNEIVFCLSLNDDFLLVSKYWGVITFLDSHSLDFIKDHDPDIIYPPTICKVSADKNFFCSISPYFEELLDFNYAEMDNYGGVYCWDIKNDKKWQSKGGKIFNDQIFNIGAYSLYFLERLKSSFLFGYVDISKTKSRQLEVIKIPEIQKFKLDITKISKHLDGALCISKDKKNVLFASLKKVHNIPLHDFL